MTIDELIRLRKRLGLSQAEMADRIGLALRSYNDLETGKSKLRTLHVLAIEWASMAIAVERGNVMLAAEGARHDAFRLYAIASGSPSAA